MPTTATFNQFISTMTLPATEVKMELDSHSDFASLQKAKNRAKLKTQLMTSYNLSTKHLLIFKMEKANNDNSAKSPPALWRKNKKAKPKNDTLHARRTAFIFCVLAFIFLFCIVCKITLDFCTSNKTWNFQKYFELCFEF